MGDMADYICFYGPDNDDDARIRDRFNKDIWVTGNGTEIPLAEMKTSHINRSIAFIERGRSVYELGKAWLPKLNAELVRRARDEKILQQSKSSIDID